MSKNTEKNSSPVMNFLAVVSPSIGMASGVILGRFFSGQPTLGIAVGACIGTAIGICGFLIIRRIFTKKPSL